MADQINIRWARKDDMATVLKFIQDLANEENMSFGPEIDAKVLEKDCFRKDLFKCYIIEDGDGKPIGYAIFFFVFSSWKGKALMLEDIYIQPGYRLKGIGKCIFSTLSKFAVDNECSHIDFNVLNWNMARNFYDKIGAVNLSETKRRMRLRYTKDYFVY